MKSKNIKLYSFTELSKKSQEKFVEEHLDELADQATYDCNYEREGTLEAFKDLFGIEDLRCDVDAYDWDFDFNIKEGACGLTMRDGYLNEIDPDNIKGKYLRRFLNKNIYDEIICHATFYKNTKRRNSKIILRRDDCPLTGVIFDNEILAPLWRVYDSPIPEDYGVKELIYVCLDNFFRAWSKSLRYYEDTQNLINYLETSFDADEEKFLEDGTLAPACLVA